MGPPVADGEEDDLVEPDSELLKPHRDLLCEVEIELKPYIHEPGLNKSETLMAAETEVEEPPPPMAFSPVVIPAVADGIVEFTTTEGITELYDVGESCVKVEDVKAHIGDRKWETIEPYLGEDTYKSYVMWRGVRAGGWAQGIMITVNVTDTNAVAVRWMMTDIDDPASHFDVDPNDTVLNPDGTIAGCVGIGGDNTGRNGPKFFQLRPYPFRRINVAGVLEPVRNPRFPVRNLIDFTGMGAVTGIINGKSGVIFRPTNDGGDNFKIQIIALDGDGNELCCGDEVAIVVWRKFNVKVYAMAKEEDGKKIVFYPGKDLTSLQNRFKDAFYPDNDPDHNCYIEIHLEQPTDWQVELRKVTHRRAVGEVENVHTYTVEKTNYHQAPLTHPLNTAQLIGARFRVNTSVSPPRYERGKLGCVVPFPHSWVFHGNVASWGFRRFCFPPITFSYGDSLPMSFRMYILRRDGSEERRLMFINDVDRSGHIDPWEMRDSLEEGLRDVEGISVSSRVQIEWVSKRFSSDPEVEKYPRWFVYFDYDLERIVAVRFENSYACPPVVERLDLPTKYPIDPEAKNVLEEAVSVMKERVSIHEIGHILYNAGGMFGHTLPSYILNPSKYGKIIKNLSRAYHDWRCSDGTRSVSNTGYKIGTDFFKFSPLIARDFRCSINRYFRSDKDSQICDGSPIGD